VRLIIAPPGLEPGPTVIKEKRERNHRITRDEIDENQGEYGHENP
jgi:hypothetical protein